MGILSTLTIGKQGLLAQGRAIQVTSNNISNVNTPGYTRQRPVFEPVSPTYVAGGYPLGGGVDLNQVERVADAALDAQLQREKQTLAYTESREAALSRLEGIFEELSGTGLAGVTQDFFRALNDLAVNPDSIAVRESIVQAGVTLTDLIQSTDRRLVQLGVDQNTLIQQAVTQINTLASNIADINRQIFQKEVGGEATASSLRDRREVLLSDLGKLVDFTSFEAPTGEVSVFVGGGFLLVDREVAGSLGTTTDQSVVALSDPTYLHVLQTIDGQSNGPITSSITGGILGAAINMRDDRIESYRDQLDEFAFTLANRVNTQHLLGFGLDDNTARRFFVDSSQAASAVGTNFASVDGAASSIAVHADIVSNSRHVAAGGTSVGGAGANPGDNANALLLAAVERTASAFFQVGDPVAGPATGPTLTIGNFLDSIAGTLGAEVQAARRSLSQAELVVAELEERRGALSGVNIDEEVTQLIAFERAYQASARVIQIADNLLQELLNI